MTEKTFFGFRKVEKSDKTYLVRDVFSSVAEKYDIMNDAMSLGIHRLWKNRLIDVMRPRPGSTLLDVAGGTGDIAFRFLGATEGGQVTVCDINQDMLAEGRKRSIDKNILHAIEWVCGDAENLPFPDARFDYYTIAFGIRNVTDVAKALSEAFRVLRPGGRFICLEFSHVDSKLLGRIYDIFSFQVIPRIGKIVANDEDSYRYLVESIRKFPPQEEFMHMIQQAGFVNVKYTNLSGGIVALHSGWKV